MMNGVRGTAALALLLVGISCGRSSGANYERDVLKQTEVVDAGSASPLRGRLSFRAPEAMAIQEVPFDPAGETRLKEALARYRRQWTFNLAIGPKADVKVDPARPLQYDIENNGGMWGDFKRNQDRLMFEMSGFIRLRTKEGKDIEPALVEFQRSFGMGMDRSFIIVFPKTYEGRNIAPPFEILVREFGQGIGTMHFPVKEAPAELPLWRVKRLWKGSEAANVGSGS